MQAKKQNVRQGKIAPEDVTPIPVSRLRSTLSIASDCPCQLKLGSFGGLSLLKTQSEIASFINIRSGSLSSYGPAHIHTHKTHNAR